MSDRDYTSEELIEMVRANRQIPWPTNPRIEHHDGSTTPVELVYDGLDADGLHCFSATATYDPIADDFCVDTLPGRTSISLNLPTEETP